MSTVLRWVLADPYDSDPTTNTYTFPRNPASMTSVYPDRAVTAQVTTFGKRLFIEGTTPAKQFTFAGPILEKSHFDALRDWCYNHTQRINLHDHFGRIIKCVLVSVDMVPKTRINYYYSHDYTVTALIDTISEPTVTDAGPQ